MKTKTSLGKSEIECLRILTAHLRDVNCTQKPDDIQYDLYNIAEQIDNMTIK